MTCKIEVFDDERYIINAPPMIIAITKTEFEELKESIHQLTLQGND